jgi:hypothetical protein
MTSAHMAELTRRAAMKAAIKGELTEWCSALR